MPCKPNRGKCSICSIWFYFLHHLNRHLKNFEHWVAFETGTLEFIYTYKNAYVEVVVSKSTWLLFFDRAVTRGSILSSFIESCGSTAASLALLCLQRFAEKLFGVYHTVLQNTTASASCHKEALIPTGLVYKKYFITLWSVLPRTLQNLSSPLLLCW